MSSINKANLEDDESIISDGKETISLDLERNVNLRLSTPQNETQDEFLVMYDGAMDPLDPQNLAAWRKWIYAAILGVMTLCVTFASSVFSTTTRETANEFGVSVEVMTLGTALFIAGFSVGPMLYGPMSELWGRKKPLMAGYFLFVVCQIPVGVAQNVETIMLFRFFGGVTAAGPLSIVGGCFSDLFGPVQRGLALCVLSGTTYMGSVLGPIIGGFMTRSSLGWRWTAWMTMIIAASSGLVGLIVLPETYAPILLTQKARKIRFKTHNWAVHSKLEETPIDINAFITKYLNRPWRMFLLEPILVLVTLYLTLIFGFVYLLFEAWPISFIEQRGYNTGVGALPFIALGVGVVIGSVFVAYDTCTRIALNYKRDGYITPEDRLYTMIYGAVAFPIGVFWFAWTSFPTMNPWPQIISGVPIGIGVQIIYLQGLAYLVDVYTTYANSAISAHAAIRSSVAAGIVMFAIPMYRNLGVQWATSILGFLGVAFIPVPVLFWIYGARIRKLSKYAPTL